MKIKYNTWNARDDWLTSSPVYKPAFRHHRCLVPVSGYFEWKHEGSKNIPYYFKLKNQDLFALADLYSIWHDKDGNELGTYTIITTEPNEVAKPIHDRMPCILKPEDEEKWIDPSDKTDAELLDFLYPYYAHEMVVTPVNAKVNDLQPEWEGFKEPLSSK